MRAINPLPHVALVMSVTLAATADAQLQEPPNRRMFVDNALNLFYHPATGELAARANGVNAAGDPLLATTLEIVSAGGLFNIANLSPTFGEGDPFAVATPEKLFRLTTAGESEIYYGSVLPTELSYDFVFADLTVNGSSKPQEFNSWPGGGPYLVFIPEPSGLLLGAVGLLGLVRLRRVK